MFFPQGEAAYGASDAALAIYRLVPGVARPAINRKKSTFHSHLGVYPMRHHSLALLAIIILTLTACGGDKVRTEHTFPVDQAISVSNPEGVTAKMIYFKQSQRYLIVSFQIINSTADKIGLKNDSGSQLAGFTATCEGRQINADRRGTTGWSPFTGVQHNNTGASGVLEIGPGQTTEVQVRWNYSPALSRKDFDWTVVIGNIFQGDKKLGDLNFSYSPKAASPAK
jgi:hypothetical protein